jgi:peptide subunit release factor RF-3
MKKLLILSALAFAFSQCTVPESGDTCVTCEYEYNGEVQTSGHQCGTEEETKAVEDEWMANEQSLGVDVTCVYD